MGGRHEVIRPPSAATTSGGASRADPSHPADARNPGAGTSDARPSRARFRREIGKVPIITALGPNFPLV
jgi:hypothetical protein